MAGADQAMKDIFSITPLLTLWAGAVVILLLAPIIRRANTTSASGVLCLLTLLLSLAFQVRSTPQGYGTTIFAGGLEADTLSSAAAFVLIISALLACLIAMGYLRSQGLEKPEYYGLLLLSLSGAYVLLLANDLLFLLMGIELMSFSFYVLTGFNRASSRSEEAALKYFLTGAFATALLLYGMMLFYGVAGSTELGHLRSAVAHGALRTPMGVGAVILTLTGLAFKVAAVPYHQWTPDVYEGAPTSVTAFLAATAKIGAFTAFLRLADALAGGSSAWVPALRTIAIVTMAFGNLIAISQTNVKRMLGYSAIAHAGYLLAAVLCVGMFQTGQAGAKASMPAMNAAVFYLLAYALAVVGAFGVLAYLSSSNRDVQKLEDLRGLTRWNPVAGYALVVFMLSLAGIPATAGFIGKWQIFYAVVTANDLGLALAVALTSALGAYYYLRVVWYAVFEEPQTRPPAAVPSNTPSGTAIYLSAAATVLLGVMPGFLMEFLRVVR